MAPVEINAHRDKGHSGSDRAVKRKLPPMFGDEVHRLFDF